MSKTSVLKKTKKTVKKQAASTEQKVKAALAVLVEGSSVRAACKQAGVAPSTFFLKINENEKLSEQYARAMAVRSELLLDEIIEIADDSSGDKKEALGVCITDGENIQRSKLRVDARKWAISKMNPKKYGELLKLAGDREDPVTINIVRHPHAGAK